MRGGWLLALVVVLGAAFSAYRFNNPVTAATHQAAIRLAGLSLPNPQGASLALAQLQGQVRVLNFWATWCPPCRKEMPGFARLSRKFAAQGVAFVGISIDEAEKVQAFQKTMDIPYPLLIADADALTLTTELGNPGLALPFTLVLDRQGKPALEKVGVVDEAQLEALLSRLAATK